MTMEPEQPTKARTDDHRIAGLTLTPVMTHLGFATEVEVDLSLQRQIVDMIAVRRVQVVEKTLPPIYWQVFGDLNEHNLISFKSYSEVFNAQALEEFYGHLTNYCKVRAVPRREINLYAITNHFPRDLLQLLRAQGLVTEVRPGEVYDLRMSSLKPVRIIVCSQTDNPILALFSTDMARIQAAYRTLATESTLFAEVSVYWQQILKRLNEEIPNMYTKEDFLRDYPPTADTPVLFGWQLEEWRKEIAKQAQQGIEQVFKQGIEQGIEQGELAMRGTIERILQQRLGDIPSTVYTRLSDSTLAQLNDLVNAALDADSWEAFIAALPKPAA